ncbi:phage minor head protein [Kitasatospora sp. NPDC057198]|uniref:phage minor head protein n=1 Tax=Kitasatospora sp. NPDC057198 TaxID=3346046 RepID=UPI00362A168E
MPAGRTALPASAADAPALEAAPPKAAKALGPGTDLPLDAAAADALRARLDDTLQALATRWTERTVARLNSPQHRKGTRHWDDRGHTDPRAGAKQLPAEQIVDAATWQQEAAQALQPLIEQAADAAADDLHTTIGTTSTPVAVWPLLAPLLADSLAHQAHALAEQITEADRDDKALPGITDTARSWGRSLATWASTAAGRLATATVESARDQAATASARVGLVRRWVAHDDGHTRPDHDAADGQTQPVGQPFTVGDDLLRHPGDPTAPPGQTVNCRCCLAWHLER